MKVWDKLGCTNYRYNSKNHREIRGIFKYQLLWHSGEGTTASSTENDQRRESQLFYKREESGRRGYSGIRTLQILLDKTISTFQIIYFPSLFVLISLYTNAENTEKAENTALNAI